MTVSTRFALKVDATHGTGDMLLTLHLVDMKSFIIFKVEITDLAVIVLCNLVRPQIFLMIETTAAVSEGATKASARAGRRRLSIPG